MSSATLEPTTLEAAEAEVAAEAAHALAGILPAQTKRRRPQRVVITPASDPSQQIEVPAPAFELLVTILTEMANGNAVTVMPIHAELTTQEAANMLNVSRPYLVGLLEEGKLPFRKVGTRRRVLLADLLTYKSADDARRRKAAAELTALSEEEDMGY
jgi:excisionase family DNA binding protein